MSKKFVQVFFITFNRKTWTNLLANQYLIFVITKTFPFHTVHGVLKARILKWFACKEIQPVHSEGDQLWDFFGRNDAKAETPVLWPPHAKS